MRKIILSVFFFLLVVFSGFAQSASPQQTTATAGTLTVTAAVTYTTDYYYAVWISNPDGSFLRTLTMYGYNTGYYSDMTHWYSESSSNKVNA